MYETGSQDKITITSMQIFDDMETFESSILNENEI